MLEAIDRLTVGRTTLAVTHDATMALASDRVVWMEDGRIALDGTPEQLLAEPSGRFAAWVDAQLEGAQVGA